MPLPLKFNDIKLDINDFLFRDTDGKVKSKTYVIKVIDTERKIILRQSISQQAIYAITKIQIG